MYALFRAPQQRVELVRAYDIGELGGVRNEIAPAVAHADLRDVLQDIKAHPLEHDAAGRLDLLEVSECSCRAFHTVAGGHEQVTAAANLLTLKQGSEILHFEKRLLRTRKNHQVERIVFSAVAGVNAL